MDTKKRCQSCGMAVTEGYYGTEIDGVTTSDEYCKFCYQNGVFTQADLSMEDMIELSIHNMTEDLRIPLERASTLARTTIPLLKRWQH